MQESTTREAPFTRNKLSYKELEASSSGEDRNGYGPCSDNEEVLDTVYKLQEEVTSLYGCAKTSYKW